MLVSLACSSSLSYWFNWGSMLGMTLVVQIITGVFLMMNYNSLEPFDSIMFITYEVNYGWLFKLVHRNNASIIFVFLYLHLYKGIMMHRYRLGKVWLSGLTIMVLIMGAGFRGYVLVGSQMRLWAAMVITRLISVLPINGEGLIYFVWGGYSISWVTLQLLTLVHFILPFLAMGVMVYHLVSLHATGRTSLIYTHSGEEKVTFYPYFWVKDGINVVIYMGLIALALLYPYSLGEVELFEEASMLNSPAHIIPEWYFCMRYAILRRVPSKGAGVIIMILRVGVLFLYPLRSRYITPASNLGVVWVWMLRVQAFLTLLGFAPISQPFILLALLFTGVYFVLHLGVMVINLLAGEAFATSRGEEGPGRDVVGTYLQAGVYVQVRSFSSRAGGSPRSRLSRVWGYLKGLWREFVKTLEEGDDGDAGAEMAKRILDKYPRAKRTVPGKSFPKPKKRSGRETPTLPRPKN